MGYVQGAWHGGHTHKPHQPGPGHGEPRRPDEPLPPAADVKEDTAVPWPGDSTGGKEDLEPGDTKEKLESADGTLPGSGKQSILQGVSPEGWEEEGEDVPKSRMITG